MKFAGTCLYVDDVSAAMDFYRRAFGFATRHFDEALQYGELETGATLLAFASHGLGAELTAGAYARPERGQPSAVEIALVTPDLQAAFARALEAGATAVKGPAVMPWGWTMAFVRGVEGTLIGIASPPASGQAVEVN
jgi:predicted enzyme related to lactoylglutathione lyase